MSNKTWINVNGIFKEVKNVWQNINGTWKQKIIPKGNINGAWKNFIQYILILYNYGVSNVPFSGYSSSFSYELDYMQLYMRGRFDYTDSTYLATMDMIDLTNYTKIRFTTELTTTSNMNNLHMRLGASTSRTSRNFNAYVYKNFTNTTGETKRTYTVDISDLTGMYYIKAYLEDGYTDSRTTLKVYKIELE